MRWTVEGYYEHYCGKEKLIETALKRGRFRKLIAYRVEQEKKKQDWELYLNDAIRPAASFIVWRDQVYGGRS